MSAEPLLDIRRDVPLAELTTLETGGPARFFLPVHDESTLAAGVAWARERGVPLYFLGGGSNVLIPDAGLDGLVIKIATRGIWEEKPLDPAAPGAAPNPMGGPTPDPTTVVRAAAGETWDDLVKYTVDAGLAGLECLSGIPGTVGAAPVQNIGAYGQEAADSLLSVRVMDLRSLRPLEFTRAECEFGYRESRFRRHRGEHAVLEVRFRLARDGAPTVAYPDLARELADSPLTLAHTRDAVMRVRRRKSMVLDPTDENRRSVGSFFTNPTVSAQAAQELAAAVGKPGLARPDEIPMYPDGLGRAKLSAAWLIEHAGIERGYRAGRVGVSTRHALALVNLGGATTADVLDLAAHVRRAVLDTFGVDLTIEPVCLGFTPPWQ